MKYFNQLAEEYAQQWQSIHKSLDDILAHYCPPQDEYAALLMIDALEQYCIRQYAAASKKAQNEFGYDYRTTRFSPEAVTRIKQDRSYRVAACLAVLECNSAETDLSIIVVTLGEAKAFEYSQCQICDLLVQRLIQHSKDLPILNYNTLRKFGFHERAIAQVVGVCSIGKKVAFHPRRQLEQNRSQISLDLLTEALSDIPHNSGYIRDDLHFSSWREFLQEGAELLDKAEVDVLRTELLSSTLSSNTDNNEIEENFVEALPGGIDPLEEIVANEEASQQTTRFSRFYNQLSPQQRAYFDLVNTDMNISDEEAAKQLGKSTQDIYNLRSRMWSKWEKMV